jgi:hypothetical protein
MFTPMQKSLITLEAKLLATLATVEGKLAEIGFKEKGKHYD